MQKPTIFFSHSSKDVHVLSNLKDLINSRTGQTVDVFLSSDGQSVPFGSNWVYKIEEALTDSTIMFVFISPNSMNSKWIYFESGYAYAKGVDVIPVGILGVNLNRLSPPLSLLQGFNLDKTDSLGNIIAKINEKYQYKFSAEFSDMEYLQTLEFKEPSSINDAIDFIYFQVVPKEDNYSRPIIEERLILNNIQYTISGDSIWVNGMQIDFGNNTAAFRIDGLMFVENLKIFQECIFNSLLSIKDDHFIIRFNEEYLLPNDSYLRKTALLKNTDIRLNEGEQFNYQDIVFRIVTSPGPDSLVRMDIFDNKGLLNGLWINEICKIILESGLLRANVIYSTFIRDRTS